MTIRNTLFAATLTGLGVQSALAADFPAEPVFRPPVAAAIFTWTGIYIGVNAGYGWAEGTSNLTLTGNRFLLAVGNDSGKLNGGVAGAQLGANYQIGSGVFGVEIDGQWSGQKNTTITGCGFGCTLNETVELTAFGTVRGRAGVAIDRVFLYGTAGLAWISAKHNATANGSSGLSLTLFDASTSKVGWTVGTGAEVATVGGLSAKIEYLYIATDGITATGSFPAILGGGTITETANIRDNILRAGLNYRF